MAPWVKVFAVHSRRSEGNPLSPLYHHMPVTAGTQTATPHPPPKLIITTKESCVKESEQGNKPVLAEDVSEEVAFQTHPER